MTAGETAPLFFMTPPETPRTERCLATLIPAAREAARGFLAELRKVLPAGVTVEILSGTRTYAEQDALYAQGRTGPGRKVTNARAGFSNHNFGIAWDIGFFRAGKYLEDSPLYAVAGSVGKRLALEWGGDWANFPDDPHFQLSTGLTLAQLRDRHARGAAAA